MGPGWAAHAVIFSLANLLITIGASSDMNTLRSLASLIFISALISGPGPLALGQQPPPTFSQIIVFGDSLSDTGNVRQRTNDLTGGVVDYPSHSFNYSNGRFTNDDQTDPASSTYLGVWHEQLATTFLGIQPATFSLGGGLNFAFGGATTNNGTHEETVVTTPLGDVTITIDDMGRQMDDYLSSHTVDPTALYLVWGGANDIRNDDSPGNVTATAMRATALVERLAVAGARYIMVPNVPPLGNIPRYADDPAKIMSANAASATYRELLNEDLDVLVANLAGQGINPTIYRWDVWRAGLQIFSDGGRYGFINITSSAQDMSDVNPDQFLFWDDVHPTTGGHYQLAKTAFDAITLPTPVPALALNMATRVFVNVGDEVSIAGFMIAGTTPKRILVRGIGPSLGSQGVPNALSDPTLTLFDGAGTPIQSNDNWQDTQGPEITATGIPPQNAMESAILATLTPGRYTASLAGINNGVGNGLVEVYDLDGASTDSTLANLSTRGFVDSGDNLLIGGLIIGQGDSPIIVLRAIGPSLASSGVANPLLDPVLELHNGNGEMIAADDDWETFQFQAINATELAPTDEREAAMVMPFLVPGAYTAVVRGKDNATGVALVEAYRVP